MTHTKLAAKMLLVACLGLISACGLVFLPKAKATTLLGNPDPMSVACATGYTRSQPNFCRVDSATGIGLTVNGVCNSVNLNTLVGVPTTSRGVSAYGIYAMNSSNAIALRSMTIVMGNNNTCVSPVIASTQKEVREEVAVVAGTRLLTDYDFFQMVPHLAGVLWYKGLLTNCANCAFTLNVLGYYD